MKEFKFLNLNWTVQHNIISDDKGVIEWNFTFLPMIHLLRNVRYKKTYFMISWLIFTLQIDNDSLINE